MILILLLFLAGLSISRTAEWRTDLSLWSAAVREGPLMPRSHLCLGLAHKDRAMAGDRAAWADAAEYFQQCLLLSVEARDAAMGSRALTNLGSVAYNLGELDLAEQHYAQAVALVPNYDDAQANLASVMVSKAQKTRDIELLNRAIAEYRSVLERRPNHAQTWENLALALEMRGSKAEARAAHAKARELKPWRDGQ